MSSRVQKYILCSFLAVFFAILQFTSLTKATDLKSLDFFRASHPAHPSVVILAVDNKSLAAIGRWPWPRSVDAELLNKLSNSGPQLVAMDITFSNPENPTNDALFAHSLKDAKFPVVLAAQGVFVKGQSAPREVALPLEELRGPNNVSTGIANVSLSSDGLARDFPDPLTYQGNTYLPLSLQVTKLLNAAAVDSKNKYVNFAGPAGTFPTYSISDVLSDKVGKAELQDKIILIGATAGDLHDTLLVPTQPQVMAGVEYHANVIDNVLLNRFIKVLPNSYQLTIGLVLLVLLIFMVLKMSPRSTAYLSLAAIILLPLTSFGLWQQRIALSYIQNTLFVVVFFAFYGLYRWYVTEREKRRIRETFQNYFSPAVMQAILKDPEALKLGGKRANVTVLFSDIRNFTTISESLSPEDLTALLQEYFTEMTDEILATDGVVDKFIGDAIMAFWGAPIGQTDQADRAVKAAYRMVKKLSRLQTKWKNQGYPLVDIGVGIHSGEATVGNMGSQKRFDYTVIGDTVNIASRLEGLNKEYKTSIILSEATKDLLKKPIPAKSLGQVMVKGKTKTVKIYTISV